MTRADLKAQVAASFSRKAPGYEGAATVQKEAALWLEEAIFHAAKTIPPGPVLEIGCGTGFVTERIIAACPDHPIVITDLAPGMVAACRQKMADSSHKDLTFQVLDGEQIPDAPAYALMVSGFTFQWFSDLKSALCRMVSALRPGGQLVATFQGQDSFPEWRAAACRAGVPFTANPLPDPSFLAAVLEAAGCRTEMETRMFRDVHRDAGGFFRSLTAIGAGTRTGRNRASVKDLVRLVTTWNEMAEGGPVTASYAVHRVTAMRPFTP